MTTTVSPSRVSPPGASTPAASPPRVRSAWAMILLVVSALEFAASYRGIAAPVVLVLAAVLPFGLVRLGQLARLGTFGSAIITIVLASAAGWIALRRASSASLGGLGDALPRLLTTARPAESSASLLAPPALLVALVATVVAACVLAPPGSRGDTRFAGLLAPVVGTVAIYVPAQLLAAGSADRYGIVAVCLLVVVVGGWSVPYLRGGTKLGWRPATIAPILLVGAVALGAATLTPADPYDPRKQVTPPTVRLMESSPLSQLSSWSANPSVTILQTNVHGTGRLHLATLDTYTGSSWEVDAKYHQLGLVASPDLPPGRHRTSAKATVRIVRLAGVWLPAPGVPTSSSLDDVLVDPDDGSLARPEHARPGLRYDVAGSVESPSEAALAAAAVPTTVPERYLALPNAPAAFAQYARAAVRGASSPLEEAVALENAVSTNRRLDPKAPTGSSYGRLSTFLFAKKGITGAQAGTDEQFAAGFAVLAREVGLPSRLTVGFALGTPAANGTITVHGRDATVWPEIYLTGVGWVAFAPSPGSDTSKADANLRDNVLQRLSEQVAKLPPPDPPIVAKTAGPTRPPIGATAGPRASAVPAGTSVPTWLVAVLIVAALLVFVLGVLVALRAARRRRHRHHGARGAWAEVEDLLVLAGRRPAPGRAAPDIASEADAVFGTAPTAPATAIAVAADRETFAPRAEHGAASADVWRNVRLLNRRARSTMPAHRRVLLPVDPRPLLRRH